MNCQDCKYWTNDEGERYPFFRCSMWVFCESTKRLSPGAGTCDGGMPLYTGPNFGCNAYEQRPRGPFSYGDGTLYFKFQLCTDEHYLDSLHPMHLERLCNWLNYLWAPALATPSPTLLEVV